MQSLLYIGVLCLFFLVAIIIVGFLLRKNNKGELIREDLEKAGKITELEIIKLRRENQNYLRIMRIMAHDFRNPLSGITGLAEVLLAEEDFNDDNRQMLQLIKSTGLHSIEMVSELLRSGLDDDKEKFERSKVDLESLLFDSVELLRYKAAEKYQQIIFEGSSESIPVHINHQKIWRVFNNLIVNAIKFSNDGKQIRVTITRSQERVLIAIADEGIGIPDEEKAYIFEMFTPVKKPGTNGEQAFGIGLSISKRIIELHGGRIWFESKKNVGTTFFVELPKITLQSNNTNQLIADTCD